MLRRGKPVPVTSTGALGRAPQRTLDPSAAIDFPLKHLLHGPPTLQRAVGSEGLASGQLISCGVSSYSHPFDEGNVQFQRRVERREAAIPPPRAKGKLPKGGLVSVTLGLLRVICLSTPI